MLFSTSVIQLYVVIILEAKGQLNIENNPDFNRILINVSQKW